MANESATSAEIEREIEVQRSRVSSTIDEIQDQLSPGQLIDQVMSMTKGGGADFAKNLAHAASSNPLPIALLGASLVWLMAGSGGGGKPDSGYVGSRSGRFRDTDENSYGDYTGYGRSGSSSYGDDHGGIGDKIGHAASGVGDALGGAAGAVGDAAGRIGDAAHTVGDAIGGVAGRAGDALSGARHALDDGIHRAGDMASDLRHRAGGVSDQLNRSMHDARYRAREIGSSLSHMLENQPIVAGALALAAGAALGAIVPRTRAENELMGEAADQVKSAVGEAAKPLLDEGRDLLDEGREVLEEGRTAVEETFSKAKDAVGSAIGSAAGGTSGSSTSSI